jgi:hypothetical protein
MHVAEIFERRRIVRVQADRLLQLGAGFRVLALGGIDCGEIVVRLGKLRVLLHQLLEDGLRLCAATRVGEQDRFQETQLRVLRVCCESSLGALECSRSLPRVMQAGDFGEVLGGCAPARRSERAAQQQTDDENPGQHRWKQRSPTAREREFTLGRTAILNRL